MSVWATGSGVEIRLGIEHLPQQGTCIVRASEMLAKQGGQANLDVLAERWLDFQYYWESTAQPFDWKFTRQDLKELVRKFDQSNRIRMGIA